ncbi:hypothetical protein SUGI_0567450 [Cryptomeria japonica]|nr:hypothetical protein SUGI_0567450 [Cryptomeria japonica]
MSKVVNMHTTSGGRRSKSGQCSLKESSKQAWKLRVDRLFFPKIRFLTGVGSRTSGLPLSLTHSHCSKQFSLMLEGYVRWFLMVQILWFGFLEKGNGYNKQWVVMVDAGVWIFIQ